MTDRQNAENEGPGPSSKEMEGNSSAPLKPPPIDPERIAALIDGRLSSTEREALLAQLDASPEMFEAYVDAVSAMPEISAESGAAEGAHASPASQRRPRPFRSYAPAIAVAAVLLIAVALSFMRGARGPELDAPRTIAAAVAPTANAATVWQRTAWSESRGATDALSARARAVRIGTRIVDLELLARTRDTSATRVALQLASLLGGIPAGGVAASEYRVLVEQGAAVSSDAARQRAATFAEQVAGEPEVRVGAWIEAARAAAGARDESFFEGSRMRITERAISSLPDLPPSAKPALAELTRIVATSPRDWPAVENALSALLRELATG